MSDGITDIRIEALSVSDLERLISAGEPGGVEFKVVVPSKEDGLARTFAAFANSTGGWLLLGVDDEGQVQGFETPGAAQPHDWLRDHLLPRIDPLPEFQTRVMTSGTTKLLAVHIPESPSAPHVLKRTGVVYERSSGSSRPIDSQSKLLSICERPANAQKAAGDRLAALPYIYKALTAEMTGPAANDQTRIANWSVAATPLRLAPDFGQLVLRGMSIKTMEMNAAATLRVLSESERDLWSETKPLGNAYEIRGSSLSTKDEMALTVDGEGAAVARWSTRLFRGVHHLPGIGDDVLLPLLRLAVATLQTAEVDGPIEIRGRLLVRATDVNYRPALTVGAANLTGEVVTESPRDFSGRLASPREEEMRRLIDMWWRELGRAAGLPLWEH